MRTRSRNTILESATHVATNSNWVLNRCNSSTASGTYAVPAQGLVIISAVSESISDELGKGKCNPCDHKRAFYAYKNPGVDVLGSDGMYYHGGLSDPFWINQYRLGNIVHPTRRDWDATSGSPPGWSIDESHINEVSLKNDVEEKAAQLKADVLLNLVEANQIWPSISSLASSLPNMARDWSKIRKLVKTASGSYLAWKFGVSPILSDMMNIQRFVPQIGRDFKRHVTAQSSRFSSQATPIWSYGYEDSLIGSIGPMGQDRRISQGIPLKSPSIRYVLVVKPKVQYGSSLFKTIDYFTSRFASSPASLLWEKIPFSFVVDWFVDLRGVLKAVDNSVGFSPYEIVSFSRSSSYSVRTEYFHKQLHSCDGSTITDGLCLETEFSRYTRSRITSGSLPTYAPRFGKNQAAISAALISQMLAKTR